MISREQIEEIKSSIDIVKFINDSDNVSIKLTDHGNEWKGAILSSSSEGRSLSVNPKTNKWIDHASKNGGNDVLSWIAYRENLDLKKDFQEIIKIAADYARIEIKKINENDEKEQVLDTLGAVVGYYHSCLTDEWREYLFKTWGISNETIDKLKIGYAPRDGAGLQMGLKDVVHQDDLIKAGLVYDNSKYDVYQGRIIFPYLENNRVVYTIARRTERTPTRKNKKTGEQEEASKYLKNPVKTENNPCISKFVNNDIFYGIDSIKDADEVVITEGITDAMSLLQAGIPTISPVTTQFKKTTLPDMLQLVKEIENIYVCNDNDGTEEEEGPGDEGAFKTIDYLTENGLEVLYIQLPRPNDVDKIDLADYMKDHTVEDFRSLMDNAVVHKAVNATRSYRMNDTGNAQRMYDLFGEDLLYCHDSKRWLVWDTCRWKEDHSGTIQTLAKDTVEAMHDFADSLPDGDTEKDSGREIKQKSDIKNKWQKHASSSGSTAKLKAMVENLQSEPNIPISMEDMDLNDWILPVQNGTIDLKTGKLRESRRSDRCTKIGNVVYDQKAQCPNFMNFLEQVQPDQDTRRYIQEALGYALTGDTSEETLFFNYGTGWNGKNTLMDIVVYILGDYSINIDSKTILTSDTQTSTTDYEVARMKGARLVTASEPEKGKTLNDSAVKKTTNSKALITARKLYQEPFDFVPTHKTFFSANHKPHVKDNSKGTWRRIRLIPFNVEITEDNRDAELPDNLRTEASGILNWLITGCKSWQAAKSLKMSAEIELATSEYKVDMDMLTEFLKSVVVEGNENDTVPNKWLIESYNKWALDRGFKDMNYRTFSLAMMERGHKRVEHGGSKQWICLKLDITKIKEIHERYPLTDYKKLFEIYKLMYERDVEDIKISRGLVDSETITREFVEYVLETLKRYNNNGNGSCSKDTIEKEVSDLISTNSLDSEKNSTDTLLKTDDDEKVNSDKRLGLTKYDKNMIIEDMKKHYEGKTGELLTTENLNQYAVFVHKKYDAYSIYDIMIDAKNKYNLEATA